MSAPRARTPAEMSAALMDYLMNTARYWATVRLEGEDQRSVADDRLYRLTGLLHSMIVGFDGCAGGLPFGVELRTTGHPDNDAYHRENGEDWYPSDVVLDGLRELWREANK